ncbi:hypothetical protein EDB86DRAFT_2976466 [Lactarius hatsudake]|nr:hypothetical protein EDB86DRAFT_2976466 [Lactarius hatsudake]
MFERDSVQRTTGLKVEFVGNIGAYTSRQPPPHRAQLFYDHGHHQEFLSLSQEVAAPGDLRQAQTFGAMPGKPFSSLVYTNSSSARRHLPQSTL